MDPLGLSQRRCTPTPVLFCAAHLRRTGSRVPADRVIDDEAFCRACFHDEPISPAEKLRRQSQSQRKNLQNSSHLSANPRLPRDSNALRTNPPAVETPGLDADQTESPGVLNEGIPESHRLTALEMKLLNALQEVLLNEARIWRRFMDTKSL